MYYERYHKSLSKAATDFHPPSYDVGESEGTELSYHIWLLRLPNWIELQHLIIVNSELNWIQFNSIQFNLIELNSIQFNSIE